jgi:hypothetical protein
MSLIFMYITLQMADHSRELYQTPEGFRVPLLMLNQWKLKKKEFVTSFLSHNKLFNFFESTLNM